MKKGAVSSTLLVIFIFLVIMIVIIALAVWSQGKFDLGIGSFWDLLGGGGADLTG